MFTIYSQNNKPEEKKKKKQTINQPTQTTDDLVWYRCMTSITAFIQCTFTLEYPLFVFTCANSNCWAQKHTSLASRGLKGAEVCRVISTFHVTLQQGNINFDRERKTQRWRVKPSWNSAYCPSAVASPGAWKTHPTCTQTLTLSVRLSTPLTSL